jgi:hypothetical protein
MIHYNLKSQTRNQQPKMKLQKSIYPTLCLSAILLTPVLNAAIVVDFTTNFGTTNSRAADTDTNTGDTWNFSTTTALIEDTTLQAGESNKRVYGGVITTWATSQAYAPLHRILDVADPNPDRLQLQVNPTTLTGGTSAKGVWLWNKADFLNGFNSGTLSIGAGDSLSLDVFQLSGGTTSRFVVNQAGTYYVSSASSTNSTGTFSIADLSTQTWAPLDTTDYSIGSFSSVALNDVQGVGVFFNLAPSGNNQSLFGITDFQLNVIPEPSVALLCGFGFLALLRRRKNA